MKVQRLRSTSDYFNNHFRYYFDSKFLHVVVPALPERSNAMTLLVSHVGLTQAEELVAEANTKKKIPAIHERIPLSLFPPAMFTGRGSTGLVKDIFKAHLQLQTPQIAFVLDYDLLSEEDVMKLIATINKAYVIFDWPPYAKKPEVLLVEEIL